VLGITLLPWQRWFLLHARELQPTASSSRVSRPSSRASLKSITMPRISCVVVFVSEFLP
jgi:hypothetical protein